MSWQIPMEIRFINYCINCSSIKGHFREVHACTHTYDGINFKIQDIFLIKSSSFIKQNKKVLKINTVLFFLIQYFQGNKGISLYKVLMH